MDEDSIRAIRIMNQHWEQGFAYTYPLKRGIYQNILAQLEQPLITALTGPRRVGKTVLMKQLINELVARGFPRQHILFFSFDEESCKPLELVEWWERQIGKKIRGKNFFLFLDETQKLENWAQKLKVIYDNLGIKIILSGSASLDIRKGSESLAGRVMEFHVPPLSYKEYLVFAGKPASAYGESEYIFYMQRQLPELAMNLQISPPDYIKSIVKKVIYEDIVKYFEVKESDIIDAIFKIICRNPGQIIVATDLAKDLGISRPTVVNYLVALEKSYLVRKLYNFSNNPRKVEVRAKKYYAAYTSLLNYVPLPELPRIIENEVAWKVGADYFWNERGKEIDFVAGKANDTGIEVKIRRKIDRGDVKWLLENPLKLKRKVLVCGADAEVAVRGIEVIKFHRIEELLTNL